MKRLVPWLVIFPLLLQGEIIWKIEKDPASIEITLSSEKIPMNESLSVKAAFDLPEGYAINDSFVSVLFNPINPLSPLFTIRSWEFNPHSLSMEVEPGTKNFLFSLYRITLQPTGPDLKKIEMDTPVFEITVLPPKLLDIQFLPIGPLLPLEPEFPLALSESNRQAINNPVQLANEAQRNAAIFKKRSYPWGSLLFILLSGLLIRLAIAYKKKRSLVIVPERTPKEKALQAIALLKKKGESQKADFKELYRELKNHLLSYLEEVTKQTLKNRTTEEMRSKIFPFGREQSEFLMGFLNRADFIVFGNEPSLSEWENDMQNIKEIIQD
jgi:hypothetical protein